MTREEILEQQQIMNYLIEMSLLDAHKKANLKMCLDGAIQCFIDTPDKHSVIELKFENVMNKIMK